MSGKSRRCQKTCGMCGRVSDYDIGRHYCPVAAATINKWKPADSCVFFVRSEERRWKERRNGHVC